MQALREGSRRKIGDREIHFTRLDAKSLANQNNAFWNKTFFKSTTTNPTLKYSASNAYKMAPREEDLIDEEPPEIEPYTVLGIEKIATADEIKSAYRKAALKHHPGMEQSLHLFSLTCANHNLHYLKRISTE